MSFSDRLFKARDQDRSIEQLADGGKCCVFCRIGICLLRRLGLERIVRKIRAWDTRRHNSLKRV